MAIDFKGKDVTHSITVKFIPAYLPDAKKAYNLKTAHQQVLDVHGIAPKAEGTGENRELAGVYLESKDGGLVQVKLIAINEPRTLKIVVPDGLTTGDEYRVLIRAQSSAKNSGNTVKTMREVRSDFLTAARE